MALKKINKSKIGNKTADTEGVGEVLTVSNIRTALEWDKVITTENIKTVLEWNKVITTENIKTVLEWDKVITTDNIEIILDKVLDKKLDERDLATKSYVGEVLVEQRKEYERYIGALVEDFNDKVKSLGEGISMILERGAEDSEKNRREHEWFKMKIARLDAKVF